MGISQPWMHSHKEQPLAPWVKSLGIVARALTTSSLRSSTTTNSSLAWLARSLSVMAVPSALLIMVQPIAKQNACWAGARKAASTALPPHRQPKAHAWDVTSPQSILAWKQHLLARAVLTTLQPWMHCHKAQA